jgi:hypothetical protein
MRSEDNREWSLYKELGADWNKFKCSVLLFARITLGIPQKQLSIDSCWRAEIWSLYHPNRNVDNTPILINSVIVTENLSGSSGDILLVYGAVLSDGAMQVQMKYARLLWMITRAALGWESEFS